MCIGVPHSRGCRTLYKNSLYVAKHARVLQKPEATRTTADTEDKNDPPKNPVCIDLVTQTIKEEQEIQLDEPNASDTQNRYDAECLEGSQCVGEEIGSDRAAMLSCCQFVNVPHEDLAEDGDGEMDSQGEDHEPVFEEETAETDIADVGAG